MKRLPLTFISSVRCMKASQAKFSVKSINTVKYVKNKRCLEYNNDAVDWCNNCKKGKNNQIVAIKAIYQMKL